MKKAAAQDKAALLNYLHRGMADALYMYIDISMEGLDSPVLDVWMDESQSGPGWVVMRYHDSIQLYHADAKANPAVVLPILKQVDPLMVSGPAGIIQSLVSALEPSCSAVVEGAVFRFSGSPAVAVDPMVEEAGADDLSEVAALICSNPEIGGHYRQEDLQQQLLERLQAGMGRHKVIRRNGRIVAHYATYAEMEDVAVEGGLITDPAWRGRGFGTKLVEALTAQLAEEGKQIFLFCTDAAIYPFYEQLGMSQCAEYGKVTEKGGLFR